MNNGFAAIAAALGVAVSAVTARSSEILDLGGETVPGTSLDEYDGKELTNGTLRFSANQNNITIGELAVGSGATLRFEGNALLNMSDGTITVKKGGVLSTGAAGKFYMAYNSPGTNRLVIDGGIAEFGGNYTTAGNYPLGVPCIWKKGALDGLSAELHVINGGILRTTVEGANLVMGFGNSQSYSYDWKNICGELVVSNATLSLKGEIFPAGQLNKTPYTGRSRVLFKDADVTCRQIYVYQYPQDVLVEFDNATVRWAGERTSFIGRNASAAQKPFRILSGGLRLEIPSGKDLVIDANSAPLPGEGGVTKTGGGSLAWSRSGSMEFTGPMTVEDGSFTSSLDFAACAFSAMGRNSVLSLSGRLKASAPALSATDGGRLSLAGAAVPAAATLHLASGGSTDLFTRDGTAAAVPLGAVSLSGGAVLELDVAETENGWTADSWAAGSYTTDATESDPVEIVLSAAGEVPEGETILLPVPAGEADLGKYVVSGIDGDVVSVNGMLALKTCSGLMLLVR